VTARQFTYEPNVVTLTVGKPYQVVFRSADTTHGVGGLSALGLACPNGVTPTQPCTLNVTPTAGQVGTYDYACTIFCGSGHGTMNGKIVVVNP
jgi:heme/copper-type cytochrome/quinol oxidase subunit 2